MLTWLPTPWRQRLPRSDKKGETNGKFLHSAVFYHPFLKVITSPESPTDTISPGPKSPSRINFDNGFSILGAHPAPPANPHECWIFDVRGMRQNPCFACWMAKKYTVIYCEVCRLLRRNSQGGTGSGSNHNPRRPSLARFCKAGNARSLLYFLYTQAKPRSTWARFTSTPSQITTATVRP